jgi:hypothetical protein
MVDKSLMGLSRFKTVGKVKASTETKVLRCEARRRVAGGSATGFWWIYGGRDAMTRSFLVLV